MAVPVAAVHENSLVSSRKSQIWRSRQIASIESISIAKRMKKATHCDLGTGVSSAYSFHNEAATFRRNVI